MRAVSWKAVLDGSCDASASRFVKPALEALCDALDYLEVPLRFFDGGIVSYAMDHTHTVYCRMEVQDAVFERVEVDGQVDVCVDGEALQAVLKRVRARDGLRLGVAERNALVVEPVKDGVRRPFYLFHSEGFEEAWSERLDVPYDVRVKMEPAALADAVRDADALASLERLEVVSDGERVVVRSSGKRVKEIVEFEGEIVDGEGEEVAQEYSVDLLSPIVKVASSSVASKAEVRFGEALPLVAEVWLGAAGEVRVEVVVAPRIEGPE